MTPRPQVLVVDNYDSFTYNLVQGLTVCGADVEVCLSDTVTVEDVAARAPDGIVLSPGPCTPREAGISVPVVRRFAGRIPILGVCLGHQAIGSAFGARVVRAARVMHGKTSAIAHDGQGVFAGLPNPFVAMRYHSLVVDPVELPDGLVPTAWTAEGELMGLRDRSGKVEGVQFHPESILTEVGPALLANFVARLCARVERAAG